MEKAKITKDAKGSYIVSLHGFEFHVMRFGRKWTVDGHDTREAVGPGTFEGSDYEAAVLALDRANADNRHPHTTTTLKAMVAWLEAHITPVEPTPVEPTPEPTPAVDLGATRNVLDSRADLAADDLLFAEMETLTPPAVDLGATEIRSMLASALTTKEIAVLRAMEEILSEDRIPFTMDVGELTGLRPVALGGVFASLNKKGLAWSDTTGPADERCFAMRPAGFAALAAC